LSDATLGYSRLGLGGLGFEVGEGNHQHSQAGKSHWEKVGDVHGIGEILGGLII